MPPFIRDLSFFISSNSRLKRLFLLHILYVVVVAGMLRVPLPMLYSLIKLSELLNRLASVESTAMMTFESGAITVQTNGVSMEIIEYLNE